MRSLASDKNVEALFRYAGRRRKMSLSQIAFGGFLFITTLFYFFPGAFHTRYLVIIAIAFLVLTLFFYGMTQEFLFLLVAVAYALSLLSILVFRSLFPFAILWSIALYVFYRWSQSIHPVTVQYKPPREVTPGEIAYMVEDREADERELLVTLLDLERKGIIELIPTPNDVYIRRLIDMNEVENLNPIESFVMNRVFTMTGVRTMLEAGVPLSYSEFPAEVSLDYVLNNLHEWKKAFDLTFKDYLTNYNPIYYRPLIATGRRIFYLGLAAIGWALLGAYIGFSSDIAARSINGRDYLYSFAIFGVATAMFGWKYNSALTEIGKRVMSKIRGFEEFLRRVEWPRLRWMLKTGRLTVSDLFIYSIALKLFNRIDFWLSRIKNDAALSSEDAVKIHKLWELISKRWSLSRIIEQMEGGYEV